MEQATLHPLPPDVLDEPEFTETQFVDERPVPTDPPTSPTVPPR